MSLLPSNASPLERALEAAGDPSGIPIPLRSIWDADTCPLALLPWLAWAMSIDSWSPEWSEAVQRQRVKSAMTLQRRKGTVQSIHDIVGVFGGQVAIREWWQSDPKGTPHTFDITLNVNAADGAPAGGDVISDVIDQVTRTKPLRSHFEFVQGLSASGSVGLIAAARVANYRRMTFEAPAPPPTASGSASQSFAAMLQSASGSPLVAGDAGQGFASMADAAQGLTLLSGTAANVLDRMVQTSAGLTIIAGAAAQSFQTISQIVVTKSADPVTGEASENFAGLAMAAAGAPVISGLTSNAFGPLSQAAYGVTQVTGTSASIFDGVTQNVAGTLVITGSATGLLVGMSQTAAGQTGPAGILDSGAWDDTGVWSDARDWNDGPLSGSATSVYGAMTQSASGYQTVTGAVAQTFTAMTQAAGDGSGYDVDATTYFNAMTTQPDATRKGLLNDLITGLKTDGVWSILDWFVLYASHDSQSSLLNVRNPAKKVTAVSTLAFTANKGWAGGASGYGDIGEVANASGNNYSQNSASKGAYCNVSVATGGAAHFGVSTDTTARIIATSGSETFSMNDSAGSDVLRAGSGTSSTARLGHRYATRVASNDKRGFFNGSLVSTKTSASTAVSTGIPRSHYSNGTLSGDTVACIWLGGGMTDTQANALHNRLHTYLTAIGANY